MNVFYLFFFREMWPIPKKWLKPDEYFFWGRGGGTLRPYGDPQLMLCQKTILLKQKTKTSPTEGTHSSEGLFTLDRALSHA